MATRRLHRVLLIDDNEADNFYHQYVIDEAGLTEEVRSFTYADEALAYLKDLPLAEEQVDLLFLDLNMPRMNGFQFLEEYKRLTPKQQARFGVVLLTNSLNSSERSQAVAYKEVLAFYNKPLEEGILEDLYGQLLCDS